MVNPQYIVVTLHCPRGFRSKLLPDEARQLPVQTLSIGFSQIILVFAFSAASNARDFAVRADGLRQSDPAYRFLQVGVAAGPLRNPLPRPMPADNPLVIEAFKNGLSHSLLWEEFDKLERATS